VTRIGFNVAEGGKRSGKDVLLCAIFARMLHLHPNRLHLIGGVSSGAAGGIILEGDGFGLLHHFTLPDGTKMYREGKYKGKPCVYVETIKGEEKVIIIAGGDKVTSKNYFQGFGFGMIYITEANLCHKEYIKECVSRLGASEDPKLFHSLNPLAESHWYYEDVLMLYKNDPGYNWEHFTPVDNPGMTDKKLKHFIRSIPRNTVWYDRDIKGLRRQAEGLVYPHFNRTKHVVPTEARHYSRHYIAVDWGARNPFAMQLWGLCENVWYMVKEFTYVGKEDGRRFVDDYVRDLEKFAESFRIEGVIVDPSATIFIDTIYRKWQVYKADNAVAEGLESTATALHTGLIKINDCCKVTISEIEGYMFSEKHHGEDAVIKQKDHHMDAMRYFVQTTKITQKYINNRR